MENPETQNEHVGNKTCSRNMGVEGNYYGKPGLRDREAEGGLGCHARRTLRKQGGDHHRQGKTGKQKSETKETKEGSRLGSPPAKDHAERELGIKNARVSCRDWGWSTCGKETFNADDHLTRGRGIKKVMGVGGGNVMGRQNVAPRKRRDMCCKRQISEVLSASGWVTMLKERFGNGHRLNEEVGESGKTRGS